MEKSFLILAPLQGYTDYIYRQTWSKHFMGLDSAMAPFLSTMGEHRLKPSRIKDILPENNTRLTVVPQILGNVARDFIFYASYIHDLGYDSVNWNLGCPHSKVAKKMRGSGLLCRPDRIEAFLSEVVPSIPCRLSIKLRLGRKSPEEIFDLLPILDRFPLEELIIHPRTGVQMYEGAADVELFGEILKRTRHNIVYNGDITGSVFFRSLEQRFPGVDRFMLGRGVLANPFLPAVIKGEGLPAQEEILKKLRLFHDDLFKSYDGVFSGPSHITNRMKGFWTFLGPSFAGSGKALKKILKSPGREQYLANMEEFFARGFDFAPPE